MGVTTVLHDVLGIYGRNYYVLLYMCDYQVVFIIYLPVKIMRYKLYLNCTLHSILPAANQSRDYYIVGDVQT